MYGTTHEAPRKRFEEDECADLQPLLPGCYTAGPAAAAPAQGADRAPQQPPAPGRDTVVAAGGGEDADDFDFSFQPLLKPEQIENLHTLGFVACRENVILVRLPGVGKSHLAISLVIAAAQHGWRVYCGMLADLITSREETEAAGRLSQWLKTVVFPSVLVVDEIGYLLMTGLCTTATSSTSVGTATEEPRSSTTPGAIQRRRLSDPHAGSATRP